jgi:hypothetical protein
MILDLKLIVRVDIMARLRMVRKPSKLHRYR